MRTLLLLLLCLVLPVRAQSGYQRPDLDAPLFDTAALDLTGEQIAAILRDLNLIARNFPDTPVVTPRTRSRALGIALRLKPDDRAAVVANGQLARGVRPVPLTCEVTPTPHGTAARLHEAAHPLVHSPSNATRQLALLLCDLAIELDPRLRRRTAPLTYLVRPDWHDPAPEIPLDAPRTFTLRESSVRILLPALQDGHLQTFAVTAAAVPSQEKSGLRVQLPAPLLEAMNHPKTGGELRAATGQHMTAVRAALRRRHDSWPEGWAVSFNADATPAFVPQLFAGIALTLDSLLAGEPLDPRLTIAAGLDADGNPQPALPPAELLSAAALADSAALILPVTAAGEITDWLLLNPERWPLLFQVTLFTAADLPDLLNLARAARAPRLAQSLAAFDQLAVQLRAAADPLTEIRKPENVAALREITTWNPRHLSAAVLLSVAVPAPATLSLRGSLAQIDALAAPILSTDRKRYPLHLQRGTFEKTDFAKAAEALQAARLLHPATRPYVAELLTLAKMLDRAHGSWKAYRQNNGPPDPPDAALQRKAAAAMRATLQ
jgi:hypothetical protein